MFTNNKKATPKKKLANPDMAILGLLKKNISEKSNPSSRMSSQRMQIDKGFDSPFESNNNANSNSHPTISSIPKIISRQPTLTSALAALQLANVYQIKLKANLKEYFSKWRFTNLAVGNHCYIVKYTQVSMTEEKYDNSSQNSLQLFHRLLEIRDATEKRILSKRFKKWKFYVKFLCNINPEIFMSSNELLIQMSEVEQINEPPKLQDKARPALDGQIEDAFENTMKLIKLLSLLIKSTKRDVFDLLRLNAMYCKSIVTTKCRMLFNYLSAKLEKQYEMEKSQYLNKWKAYSYVCRANELVLRREQASKLLILIKLKRIKLISTCFNTLKEH